MFHMTSMFPLHLEREHIPVLCIPLQSMSHSIDFFRIIELLLLNLSSVSLPKTIQEALGHTEWRTTIMEEMQALEKNGTWEIIELPRDKRTVGCKWVFTVKYQADGSIDRYKARLVAKRFT